MVESTRLESERTGNRTVGSNPTLSAITKFPNKSEPFSFFSSRGIALEGIAQHYILPRITISNVVLDPNLPLAA